MTANQRIVTTRPGAASRRENPFGMRRFSAFVGLAPRVFVLMLAMGMLPFSTAWGQERVHKVFFEGTDHELNVYHIHGKEDGPTLMLIGGIQGDEPGGYLAVDHYADISLARGNLIVVPRANFQSILLNRRQVNQDMNRTFSGDRNPSYEAEVVDILKKLIAQSDCLLNNHDGSGFFSETWQGPNRNPRRYGQSIIADAETFTVPHTGRVIDLGAMAQAVCAVINRGIKEPDLHFHFNNHRTDATDSLHKEQRKSATYYALHECHIPAYGVESSKSLSLEQKVRHHHLAINAFMDRLGIVTESPGLNLAPARLRYLVINVNDAPPIVVQEGQTLHVHPGDTVTVSHIEANYERGLSADILGAGTINDLRKPVTITESTKIMARKDYSPCGSIHVAASLRSDTDATLSRAPVLPRGLLLFRVRVNGQEMIFPESGRVPMILGDRFEIVDIIAGLPDTADLVVNLKGFVGNRHNNTGEDRGYVVRTDRDLWKRYSLFKKGLHYQALVIQGQNQLGKLFIDLQAPRLRYVVLSVDGETGRCLAPGEACRIEAGQRVRLVDIQTNVQGNQGIQALIQGPGSARYPIGIEEHLDPLLAAGAAQNGEHRIDIFRQDQLLGSVYLTLATEGGP